MIFRKIDYEELKILHTNMTREARILTFTSKQVFF